MSHNMAGIQTLAFFSPPELAKDGKTKVRETICSDDWLSLFESKIRTRVSGASWWSLLRKAVEKIRILSDTCFTISSLIMPSEKENLQPQQLHPQVQSNTPRIVMPPGTKDRLFLQTLDQVYEAYRRRDPGLDEMELHLKVVNYIKDCCEIVEDRYHELVGKQISESDERFVAFREDVKQLKSLVKDLGARMRGFRTATSTRDLVSELLVFFTHVVALFLLLVALFHGHDFV